MNYHIEHHMFPLVPYYKLHELHEVCRHDFPEPNTSFINAYAEMLPALWQQRIDPDYCILRPLPETAKPYQYGPAGTA